MSTDACHCGYKLPRVRVQLATMADPPAGLRVIITCAVCGCSYERSLKLGTSDEAAGPSSWIATNAPGGDS